MYPKYTISITTRFWSKVEKSTETDGCWLWHGTVANDGYGHFSIGRRGMARVYPAHRVAYELAYGPIPDGMLGLHKCDVRNCVRPDHLFLGTQLDNMLDMWRKGRGVSGMTTHPECIPHGEANYNARLSEDSVRYIRVRHSSGESLSSLAYDYGVSKKLILNVVHRRAWRHVT